MQRSICIMYSKYSRANVCGFGFAIIIFRIKLCYTFGHTRRLSFPSFVEETWNVHRDRVQNIIRRERKVYTKL